MKRSRALLSLSTLSLTLLGFFLLRYPVRGFRLPMGPDAPVYTWWANLAGSHEGLSVANWRPGTPALTLMVGGATGRPQSEIIAGLGGALAAAVGLAAWALVRRGGRHAPWVAWLAGLLAGTWCVHLAGGYFGNLVFAVTFLAAVALIAPARARVAPPAAAILLGAGGLAHPMFFVVGIVVLLAGFGLTRDPEARGRIWMSATGGTVLVGAGLLAMLMGPRPVASDTSADAFLRRAGFGGELRGEYLRRFGRHWSRYVPWLSLPLAWFGRRGTDDPVRPILNAWVVVALGGLVVSLATQLIPGVRLIAFAFAIPILAALGLARLPGLMTRRWLARALIAMAAFVMVAAAALTWSSERPYADEALVRQLQTAAGAFDSSNCLDAIYVVDETDEDLAAFRVTNWGNLIRASLPASQIRCTFVYVGSPERLAQGAPTLTGNPIHDGLSRTSLADLQAARVEPATARIVVVPAMNPPGTAEPLAPTQFEPGLPSPWWLVGVGVATFALLLVVGFGWARVVVADLGEALALSPAFGAAGLIIFGVTFDRFGMWLLSPLAAAGTVVVAAVGYLAAARRPAPPNLPDSVS